MKPSIAALGFARATPRAAVRSTTVATDTTAFESLYRECHRDLARYVTSIVRRPEDVDDVLQTVMVKALSALATERRDFELRPWLFRIAHNEAINRLRVERPTAELDEQWACGSAPVAELSERRSRLSQLWKDLADLTERQRQVIVLKELNGLGHREISTIVGATEGAVKQTLFEARKALMECSQGRDMPCDDVQRTLSDADGRVHRSRRVKSHLAACSECRQFSDALSDRPELLGALVPILPIASASTLLAHVLPGGHAAGAAGAATTVAATTTSAAVGTMGSGAALGGWASGLVGAKVAVVAVIGAAAVDASGAAAVKTFSPSHHRNPVVGHTKSAASAATRNAQASGRASVGAATVTTPDSPVRSVQARSALGNTAPPEGTSDNPASTTEASNDAAATSGASASGGNHASSASTAPPSSAADEKSSHAAAATGSAGGSSPPENAKAPASNSAAANAAAPSKPNDPARNPAPPSGSNAAANGGASAAPAAAANGSGTSTGAAGAGAAAGPNANANANAGAGAAATPTSGTRGSAGAPASQASGAAAGTGGGSGNQAGRAGGSAQPASPSSSPNAPVSPPSGK